jgi:hypothetical protein
LSKITTEELDDKAVVKRSDIEMNIFSQTSVLIMADMIKFLADEENGICNLTNTMILNVTDNDWKEYREKWKNEQLLVLISGSNPKMQNVLYTTNTNNNSTNANNFSKNIKKDCNQYDVLKDDRQFDNWKRSFLAVARTHELDEVFDETYIPGTSPDEQALYWKKQKFVYSVFDLTLKTDYGKTLVRKYQDTFDSHKIWIGFCKYIKTSTKAQIAPSELLSWLTSRKYDNNWKGNTRSYILYWQNKLQEYHTYCSKPSDEFSDTQKLRMLQNAVHNVQDLRQIRNNANIAATEKG